MTPIRRLGWTALALLALAGCENTPAPESTTPNVAPKPAADPTPAPSPEAKDKNDVKPLPVEAPKGADAAQGKLSEAELAEVKKLPAEDQAIALAQLTCPVSDEKLGGMDVPVKEVVDGKAVFLCCAGCEKAFKADPAKYLAKLKK